MPKLRTITKHIVTGPDSAWSENELNTVILSRWPLSNEQAIEFPKPVHPWQSKLFAGVLNQKLVISRGSLLARVNTPQGEINIASAHIPHGNPATRRERLSDIIERADKKSPLIICGDFNVLSMPHVAPLNWILGGSFFSPLQFWRERHDIEKFFVQNSLKNPLHGLNTHLISHAQLDHILVPKSANIKKAWVDRKRYGSDHNPVWLELSL